MEKKTSDSRDKLTREQLMTMVDDYQHQAYALLDALPEAAIAVDAQKRIQYINAAAYQQLGIVAGDGGNFPTADELFPKLRQDDCWSDLEQGKALSLGFLKKQAEVPVTVQARWHTDYQIYLLKITEIAEGRNPQPVQPDAESAMLQMVAAHIQEGVLIIGAEGEYQYISPSMKQLTGYTHQELQEYTLRYLIHPDDIALYEEALEQVQSNAEETESFTFQIIRKDGQVRCFRSTLQTQIQDSENARYSIWVMLDVTAERRLNDIHKSTYERYRFIVENATDGFWSWNLLDEGNDQPKARNEVLGVEEEFISRQEWEDRIHRDDLAEVQQEFQQLLSGREDRLVSKFRFLKEKDQYQWFQLTASVSRDTSGKPLRMVGIMNNIHDCNVAQQALLQKTEILQTVQSMAKIGDWRLNIKTGDLVGSEAFYQIYEIDPSSDVSVAEQIESLIPVKDMELFRDIINKGIERQEPYRIDYLITTPSGIKRWVHVRGKVFVQDKEGDVEEIIGLVHDITERKEIELTLQESESKYRLLTENASDIICLMSFNGKTHYLSPSIQTVLGYSPDEYKHKFGMLDNVHPEDIPLIERTMAQLWEEGGSVNITFREQHKKGHYVWGEAIVKRIEGAQGEAQVMLVARDITEKKMAEIALHKSETQYRLLAENATDIIVLVDMDGQLHYVSPSIENITDYTPSEWIALASKRQHIYPDDLPKLLQDLKSYPDKKTSGHIKHRINHKNGSYVWVDSKANLIRDENDEFKLLIVSRDITQELKAQQELAESQRYFQSIFNNTTDALFLLDSQTQLILDCNDAAVAIFEAESKDNLVGMRKNDFRCVPYPEEQLIRISNLVERGEVWKDEVEYSSARGNMFWGNLAVILFKQGTQLVRISDITERKKAVLALQKSEAQYRLLAENSTDIIAISTVDKEWKYMSPGISKVSGYTPEEYKKFTRTSNVHPDDIALRLGIVDQLQQGDTNVRSVMRIGHKNGGWVWVECLYNTIIDNDGEKGVLIVARDTTQRKAIEQALQQSEARYRLIADNASSVICLMTLDGDKIYTSPSIKTALGYTPEEYLQQYEVLGQIHPEDQPLIDDTIAQLRAGASEINITFRERHKDGHYLWAEAMYKLVKGDDGNPQIMIVARDITQKRRVELALKESEAKYRLLADNASDVIILFDLDWNVKYVSPSIKNTTGYTQEEWKERAFKDVHPDDLPEIQRRLTLYPHERTSGQMKHRVKHKNGTWVWLDTKTNLVRNELGELRLLVSSRNITQEVTTQQKLVESQQYFQSIFNSTTDALFLLNSQTYVIDDCNEAAVEMFGTSTKERLIGRRGHEFRLHSITNENFTEMLKRLYDNKNGGVEIEYVSDQGRVFWGNLVATPFNASHSLARITDITLLKEKEREIKQAEEQYRQVVETQQEIICRFLPDTTLTFVNPVGCRYLGKLEQEALGKKLSDLLSEVEQDNLARQIKEVKEQRGTVTKEHFIPHKSGDLWQYWTAYPIFNDEGTLLEIQAVGIDITRRKQAEEKLRKSEEQLKEALIIGKMGNFEYDLEKSVSVISRLHQILEISKEYQGNYFSPDQLINLLHPDDAPVVVSLYNEFIQDGQRRTFDYRLKPRNGKIQYLTITYGKLYRDSTGKPVRMTGTFQDITERKVKEQELEQAKKSLEKANHDKDWILSVLSHEVRNSLNAISGFANLLNHSHSKSQQQEITETLAFSSRHLLALINNIHDFSKIELGKFELQTSEFDLYNLFEKTASLFRSQLRYHINLTLTIDEQTPRYVKGDASRLHQILNNLLGNAIKFTEQGSIAIILKEGEMKEQASIQFIIEDTGSGISEEQMFTIFQPVYPANESALPTDKTTNTGLGLYIVSRLVDYLGGDIKLNSKLGKGTAVSITFPVEIISELQATSSIEDTSILQHASDCKVLYIEDDYFNRMLMAGYAQLGNLTLDFAKDGEEAKALLQKNHYHVVLTDIVLSSTDGAQIAQNIKKQYTDPALPVVAVTAYTLDELKGQDKDQYFDAVLTKPVDPNQLYHIIGRLCTHDISTDQHPPSKLPPANANTLSSFLQNAPDQKEAMLEIIKKEIGRNTKVLQQAIMQQNYLLFHKTLHTLLPFLYFIEANNLISFLRALNDLPSAENAKQELLQKLQNLMSSLSENQ